MCRAWGQQLDLSGLKSMSDIRYTAQVTIDSDGELLLSFPDELLNQMGWDVGDKLIWEELPDGSYAVRKDSDE